jgi:hypothetical protein
MRRVDRGADSFTGFFSRRPNLPSVARACSISGKFNLLVLFGAAVFARAGGNARPYNLEFYPAILYPGYV